MLVILISQGQGYVSVLFVGWLFPSALLPSANAAPGWEWALNKYLNIGHRTPIR